MSQESGHYYSQTGEPMHFVPKKDGSGNRPTTIADARKLNLLPSVTTVMRCLAKPALIEWIVQQNVLAAVTTPRLEGESLDDFVQRIMDKDAKAETDAARDRGTSLHTALELMFEGLAFEVDSESFHWVQPAFTEIANRAHSSLSSETHDTVFPPRIETVVVGDGYAGKVDLMQTENDGNLWLWDWKTTKKLPKGDAWPEHRLQLAAYAQAVFMGGEMYSNQIRTGNVYISTTEQGKFVICEHADWQEAYERGFKPLLTLWQFLNQYTPQPLETATKSI